MARACLKIDPPLQKRIDPSLGIVLAHRLEAALVDAPPRVVVLFDPDLAAVRLCELFRARRPGEALRLYFLIYESSVEEQKFKADARREREAFETLVRTQAVRPSTLLHQ